MKNLIRTLALSTVLVMPAVAADQDRDCAAPVRHDTLSIMSKQEEDTRIFTFNTRLGKKDLTQADINFELNFAAVNNIKRLAELILGLPVEQKPNQAAISAAIGSAINYKHPDMAELLRRALPTHPAD